MEKPLKQPDEIFCPECAKPIKKNAVICSYCKAEIKNSGNKEAEILQSKVKEDGDSLKKEDKNEVKPVKRPISLTLAILLGTLFLIILLSTIFPLKNFSISYLMIPFLILMPVSLFISLILINVNRKENQKRKKGFIISASTSFVLIILAATLMIVFTGSLETGNSLFRNKKYELVIAQYNLVIKQNKDLKKVELSKNKIIQAQYFRCSHIPA